MTFASVFGSGDPNGQWRLFVRDDGSPNFVPLTNQVAGGWGIQFNTPTAAGVSIGGRVISPEGRGIRGAVITISGGSLVDPITVQTGRNGIYAVNGLTVGETYVVTVAARRFTFVEPTRVVTLSDNITGFDFISQP